MEILSSSESEKHGQSLANGRINKGCNTTLWNIQRWNFDLSGNSRVKVEKTKNFRWVFKKIHVHRMETFEKTSNIKL